MSGGRRGSRGVQQKRRPRVDPARRAAYDALRQVTGSDAYANLVGPALLAERRISGRDAAFATELLNGTCRLMGSYDLILAAASGRDLKTLQPAVVDVLRLGAPWAPYRSVASWYLWRSLDNGGGQLGD